MSKIKLSGYSIFCFFSLHSLLFVAPDDREQEANQRMRHIRNEIVCMCVSGDTWDIGHKWLIDSTTQKFDHLTHLLASPITFGCSSLASCSRFIFIAVWRLHMREKQKNLAAMQLRGLLTLTRHVVAVTYAARLEPLGQFQYQGDFCWFQCALRVNLTTEWARARANRNKKYKLKPTQHTIYTYRRSLIVFIECIRCANTKCPYMSLFTISEIMMVLDLMISTSPSPSSS